MKNMAVLIDANVILDFMVSREPFYRDAGQIIEMCYGNKIRGYMAFHSVSIIWYVLRKNCPLEEERRQMMKSILQAVRVTAASHDAVVQAVEMGFFKDFEDCLQDRCAEEVNADYIITNNVKDFDKAKIEAITPEDFCHFMEEHY